MIETVFDDVRVCSRHDDFIVYDINKITVDLVLTFIERQLTSFPKTFMYQCKTSFPNLYLNISHKYVNDYTRIHLSINNKTVQMIQQTCAINSNLKGTRK